MSVLFFCFFFLPYVILSRFETSQKKWFYTCTTWENNQYHDVLLRRTWIDADHHCESDLRHKSSVADQVLCCLKESVLRMEMAMWRISSIVLILINRKIWVLRISEWIYWKSETYMTNQLPNPPPRPQKKKTKGDKIKDEESVRSGLRKLWFEVTSENSISSYG